MLRATNHQLPATNYQLPTTHFHLSALSYQLWAISYQLRSFIRFRSFSFGTNPQRWAGPKQVGWATNFNLPTFSFQLSAFSYQLWAISYQPHSPGAKWNPLQGAETQWVGSAFNFYLQPPRCHYEARSNLSFFLNLSLRSLCSLWLIFFLFSYKLWATPLPLPAENRFLFAAF